MIRQIHHIGIAVNSLDEASRLYRALGLEPTAPEEVAEQKVRLTMISLGESRVELLESTDPAGPVGRFLANRGEGIHHLALTVDNFETALDELKQAGLRLIDQTPRTGAHGTRVAFIHPRSAQGVLLELVEAGEERG